MSEPSNISTASAKVFATYHPESPPAHPGSGWTRFVCISDTHSQIFPVPDGDVLLHAGDLSSWGHPEQVEVTLTWLSSLGHPVKIIIAGNHELCLDANLAQNDQVLPLQDPSLQSIRRWMKSQELENANIYYLEHESLRFKTLEGREWSVYGSPSSPQYARGAFQYDSAEEAQAVYRRIPLDTEILLTHTPPHLVLDLTRRGKNAGCPHLAEKVKELTQCRLHVFGHIHEAWGVDLSPENGRPISVNAAVAYRGSQAIIVDLRN
ncbi:putative metallo-dependent phosphatase [Lyophyllum shimeji]|uniref:Metallo-dependent phosphatase n=1 Tax=Lyophyllum shimeji TaxID=47721 RepID=A0A9P3PGR3_LYOSH|nr:putative metallo-dependent phosphatase [Lyophyllum shimeji]